MKLSYKALEEALDNEQGIRPDRPRHSKSRRTEPQAHKIRKMRKY